MSRKAFHSAQEQSSRSRKQVRLLITSMRKTTGNRGKSKSGCVSGCTRTEHLQDVAPASRICTYGWGRLLACALCPSR